MVRQRIPVLLPANALSGNQLINRHLHRTLATIATFLWGLCACASTTIRSTDRAPDFHVEAIRRVMVIGVSQNQELRKAFEKEFVRQWRARGVDAVASFDILPSTASLERMDVTPFAKAQ